MVSSAGFVSSVGDSSRHVRGRLARRYVARLPGGRCRRIRHAGGPTGRALGGCPGPDRQGATAGPGVVSLAASYSMMIPAEILKSNLD